MRCVAIALVLTACSPQGPPPQPSPSMVATECGTAVLQGAQPKWLVDAGANNNPAGVPYVITSPPIAAGFLFGYPLTAGRTNPSNKILWVVGKPRASMSLDIFVSSGDIAEGQSVKPDSGPGEIYPSVVDVAHPGCWHIELRWVTYTATVDLLYR